MLEHVIITINQHVSTCLNMQLTYPHGFVGPLRIGHQHMQLSGSCQVGTYEELIPQAARGPSGAKHSKEPQHRADMSKAQLKVT